MAGWMLMIAAATAGPTTGNCVYSGSPGDFVRCVYDELQALEDERVAPLEADVADQTVDLAAQAAQLDAQLAAVCANAETLDQCWDIPSCVAAEHCSPHRVFITSALHGIGNYDTLAEWDDACQGYATNAGLPGTYRAWLAYADPATAPAQRFDAYPGPYQRVDGTLVAESFADLTDGTLAAPLELDEYGQVRHEPVLTGIRADGTTAATTPAESCNDWTGYNFGAGGSVSGVLGH